MKKTKAIITTLLETLTSQWFSSIELKTRLIYMFIQKQTTLELCNLCFMYDLCMYFLWH